MSAGILTVRHVCTRSILRTSPPFSPRSYSSHSSVNPTEISHFNALASTWWDPHGPSRLLHRMNPLRHDFISSCLSSYPNSSHPTPKSLTYLDIGCGGGIFAESAARLPTTKSVTAIDPSREVIAVARAHACQDPTFQDAGRLEYLNQSVEDFFIDGQQQPEMMTEYDVVSLFEVIEHINYPAPFLNHCLPLVKPGGWLILSTIARTWTSWLTTKVVAEDLLGVVPRGTHDWSKYIDESELRGFFMGRKGWGQELGMRSMGCVYVPGVGWRMVPGAERWGNYFFGVRRDEDFQFGSDS